MAYRAVHKDEVARVAEDLAKTYLCGFCFPNDDMRGRTWEGDWVIAVENGHAVCVVFFHCKAGHLVRAERVLTDNKRSVSSAVAKMARRANG